MSISTRQSTKAAISDTNNADAGNTVLTDSPQPSQASIDTPNNNITTDAEFHVLFNDLLDRVQQIQTQLSNLPDNSNKDVTTDIIPQNVNVNERNDVYQNNEQIVGDTTTRTEESRLRSLYSKFAPSKVLPRFATESIDQLESWLDINKINNDHERFLLLKMSIEPETYKQVSLALTSKQPGKEYENLKKAIIKAFTDSEAKQIQSLLSGLKLGDRRPSQLLAEMCSLYKGPTDKIFEDLFLSRIPGSVRGILVSMRNKDETHKPIETIAQWADAIIEQTNASTNINAITEVNQISILENKIEDIVNKLDAFANKASPPFKKPFNPRQFNRYENHQFGKDPEEPFICFYHRRFGNNRHDNKKCLGGCTLYKKWQEIQNKRQKN